MRSELYIDGGWVRPVRGETVDMINPATEEVFHAIAAATEEDVDLAVKAARRLRQGRMAETVRRAARDLSALSASP